MATPSVGNPRQSRGLWFSQVRLQALRNAGTLFVLSASAQDSHPKPDAGLSSAVVAQLVEHVLGKDEVKGSSPFNSYAARATVSGL